MKTYMLVLLFLFAGCFSKGDKSMSDLKVLKFEASWCGPCKIMKPVFDKVASMVDGVSFETVDIDKDSERAIDMNVMSVPTIILIKDGKTVDRFVGICSESNLKDLVEKWK